MASQSPRSRFRSSLNSDHPLLALLPMLRATCPRFGASFDVRRTLGQPYCIEITCEDGTDLEVELLDDVPTHRSRAGEYVPTTQAQLEVDL